MMHHNESIIYTVSHETSKKESLTSQHLWTVLCIQYRCCRGSGLRPLNPILGPLLSMERKRIHRTRDKYECMLRTCSKQAIIKVASLDKVLCLHVFTECFYFLLQQLKDDVQICVILCRSNYYMNTSPFYRQFLQ